MWASILAGALAAASPVTENPSAQPTPVSPVTVQAPASEVARTRSFIDAYAAPTARLGRYARWNAGPCIAVAGLAPAQGASIKARVEAVARAAGLKPAGAGCKVNVEIEFTSQPQALVDQIAAKSPQVLGYQPGADLRAQTAVSRPIQAWYMTASRGGVNGLAKASALAGVPRPSMPAPDPGTRTLGQHHASTAGAWAQTNSAARGVGGATPESVLSTAETLDGPGPSSAAGCDPQAPTCQSVFWNVLVVVDIGKVQDQPVSSLTDYVAMLALSQPRSLDGCMALPSIIDLLAPAPCQGRDPPDALTPADTAFLDALYASDPLASRTLQQSVMSQRMAGDLVTATPASETSSESR